MIIDEKKLKQRYLLRIAGVRDKKVYIGPEFVSLNIGNSCNLRCKYCWSHAPGNPFHLKKAHFFSWDKFLGIVSDCVDLNVDQVHIAGEGEPTLHPLFPDMMRHLEGKPIKVKLFTNAAFPLKYCSDVIKGDHAVINLGAVNRQQYRELQGNDFFDRVVANIERLVSLRDAMKPAFFIEIAYIVNAVNVKYEQDMCSLASRMGVNSVHFKKMDVHGYNRNVAFGGCVFEAERKKRPPACLNGWFSVVVRLDGSTSTCCRVKKMPLGNFQKMSFRELWFSPSMMRMRLQGKYGHIQKKYEACKTCLYYDENMRRLHALARNIHDH